MMGPRLKLKKV